MGLLDYFRSDKKSSASIAKERLQILVAHERAVAAGAVVDVVLEELLEIGGARKRPSERCDLAQSVLEIRDDCPAV